jgi:amino acid transporter
MSWMKRCRSWKGSRERCSNEVHSGYQNMNTLPHNLVPDNSEDVSRFGYRQQLKRSIRGFSSFALSFSLISMTTGVFAGFSSAIRHFGPALVWSWLLVAGGQLLVALVLAELSAYFPLSGYGYQWTSRLMSPRVGFFVGWALLIQFMTGFPGICSAIGQYAGALVAAGTGLPIASKWITLTLITVAALIHLFGIRLASVLNDAGVIAEIAGSITVALVLLVMFGPSHAAPAKLFIQTTSYPSGLPGGVQGFAVSMLLGAWCLTGFEAAADLAEETLRPATVVPRAVVWSLVSSSAGGLLMLAGFLLAMPDLRAVQASSTPLYDILLARLGPQITQVVMLVMFVSIFACALASLASATRLLYSMARDNMLPGSSWLKRVHPTRATPTTAIIIVWLVSCIVVLSLERIEIIASVSAIATYIGYAGIVVAAIRGMRGRPGGAGFSLGRWRTVLGSTALAWVVFLIIALTVPVADAAVGRLPTKVMAGTLAAGIIAYFLVIRARILRGEAGPPSKPERSITSELKS